jgi:hypothetical protein
MHTKKTLIQRLRSLLWKKRTNDLNKIVRLRFVIERQARKDWLSTTGQNMKKADFTCS